LVLAAAWRWTPLGDLVTVEGILESVQSLGRGPLGWLTLLSGYILGGLLVFPVTLLIVVTLVAFGPLVGPPTALMGSLLSAMAIFGLGRLLGRYRVQRLAGRRMSHLAQRIAERGMWAVLLVRLLPIAPFSTVNLVAGATPITLRDYALGTALGMTPGIVVMAMFIDRLEAVVRRPSPLAFVVLGFLIAGAWACAWYLSRRLQQGRHDALPADPPTSTVTACP
jgi:phospholipase D1/2